MSGFCEIKLAQPLDNSLLGEHLPSRRVFLDFTNNPDQEIRLSVLYSRIDQDFASRINEKSTRVKNQRQLLNKHPTKYPQKTSAIVPGKNIGDYIPNYYENDIININKEEFNSLQISRNKIIPFIENYESDLYKIKSFNSTKSNARFVLNVTKPYGTEGTVYFNNSESNVFNDISFTSLTDQIINDSFEFKKPGSTKFVSNMIYPYYVNDYQINKLGSGIRPFDVLNEIQLKIITIKNIKGVKSFLDKTDAQNQNFRISNCINVFNFNGMAPFDDEGIPDDIVNDVQRVGFNYKQVFTLDGNVTTEVSDPIKLLTNTNYENYLSQIEKTIIPFIENRSINDVDTVIYNQVSEENESLSSTNLYPNKALLHEFIPHDWEKCMSSGYDVDHEYSVGIESITFRELMD